MGNLFGGSKKESVSQNTQEKTSGTSSGTYSSTPIFDPNAIGTLNALAGNLGSLGGDAGTASKFLTSLIGGGGGMNPYAEQVVAAQNRLAGPEFAKRLASVRSSGYGGGIGRDLIDQGMFASDFTNRQYDANARTLLDAWNADMGTKLTAAGGLAGLDQNKMGAALQFLNTLRGETGKQQQDQSGTSNTSSTGKSKTTSFGGSFSFGN
jgi:hypothetical protein